MQIYGHGKFGSFLLKDFAYFFSKEKPLIIILCAKRPLQISLFSVHLSGTITVSSPCAHRQGSDPDPVGRFFPDPDPSKKKRVQKGL